MVSWTCTCCGAVERLTFTPDGCSSCGGTMETQDGRSTAAVESDADWQLRIDAWWGDPAAIVALWKSGQPLTSDMQCKIDEMLAANRTHMLGEIYREAA